MSISRKIVGSIEDQGSALQKIGSYSDTEQVSRLLERRFAVCRVVLENGQGGTGFLIGKDLILTNNHVLDCEETARKAKAVFFHTTKSKGVEISLDPDSFFYTSSTPDQLGFKCITANHMDFTIVSIHSHPKITEIEHLAFCIFDSQQPKKESHANIIHHPLEENGTTYQKVSFRDTVLKKVELFSIHYTTSTMPGSSGSPVMDDEGNLIALHRSSCTEILKALLDKLDAFLKELFPGVTFTEKTTTFSGSNGIPSEYLAQWAVIDGSPLYVFSKGDLKGKYFHEGKVASPACLFELINIYHMPAKEWALQFLKRHGVTIADYHRECNTAVPIQAICSNLQKASHLELIKKRYEACQKNMHALSKPTVETKVTVSTLQQKVLDLIDTQAILQDKEVSKTLKAKAGVLIDLNSNQDLSEADQTFLRYVSLLLRGKFVQSQSYSISEPKPITQSNVIYPIESSTKPHFSNPYPISTTANSSKPLAVHDALTTPLSNESKTALSPTKDLTFIFSKEPGSLDMCLLESLHGTTPLAVNNKKITAIVTHTLDKLIKKDAVKYKNAISSLSCFSVTFTYNPEKQSSFKIVSQDGSIVIHLKKLSENAADLLNSIPQPQIQGQTQNSSISESKSLNG